MEDKRYSSQEYKNYNDLLSWENNYKQRLYSNYKLEFDHQSEIAALTINFVKNNEEKIFSDGSIFKSLVHFFIVKAIKTFRAIQFLIENGYGEDAAVLLRCQFELLTNFLYISKEDQDNRAKKYICYSYILAKKDLNEFSRKNLFYEIYEKTPKQRKIEIEKSMKNMKNYTLIKDFGLANLLNKWLMMLN